MKNSGTRLSLRLPIIIMFSVLAAWTVSPASAQGIQFAEGKTFQQLVDSAKQTGKMLFVDCYTKWCGPCKMMHPVLEQLKKELGDSIRVIKVDIDKNESTAMQMRIQSVPTLMLFQSGEMKWRQSGAMSLADLKATIAKYQ